jgi:proton glutamate symport protein
MIALIRRISLTQWIVIAMAIGVLFGWLFPKEAQEGKIISTIFLNLVKCIVVPIIVSTLVVGIAGHGGDLKAVGRLGLKSIIYFEIVTTLALIIGLAAVNIAKPGAGVTLPPHSAATSAPAQKLTIGEMIVHAFPKNFFESAANNDVLQVVVFSIIFAIALAKVNGKPKETILNFFEGLSEVMFKFTGIVMMFAPFGVGAAMAVTIGHSGIGILASLGKLVLTLYCALIVFIFVVLLPVALWARIPLRKFLRAIKEPALIAFTTTSSDAALPVAFKKMVNFGVPKHIVSFVLPTGYTFNLDGSTLHLAVASIFVAQAAGIHLSLGQQLMIMLTLMLTSKGVAAVPRASIVILSGTLVKFGLPLEGVVLILGVDELMDMARTTVNLVGNCLASAVMARWEGELGPGTPENENGSESKSTEAGR